ncbi:MAG: transcription-repair coupling factor, partial [Actinomyces sp.]|nr:transcription-repair coupling factor [Actinomyces sp.]
MPQFSALLPVFAQDEALHRVLESIDHGESGCVVTPAGARIPLIASMAQRRDKTIYVVVPTGREAEETASALRAWVEDVEVFPSWETLPHERLSPQVDTMAQRIAVLRRLIHPQSGDEHAGALNVVVIPVRALMQPIIHGIADRAPVRVKAGDIVDLPNLARELENLGYTRVDMVEQRGQFSVRGGILDVFPPQEAHPLRVELWGDEVDEIRAFSLSDQRTLGVVDSGVWAVACRELLLTPQVRAKARTEMDRLPGAAEILELASQGIAAPGLESLAPILVGGMDSFLDLIPAGGLFVAIDPERIRARGADLVATTEEFLSAAWSQAAGGGAVPLEAGDASFIPLEEIWGAQGRPWWELTVLPPAELAEAMAKNSHGLGEEAESDVASGALLKKEAHSVIASDTLVALGARDVRPYRGDYTRALEDIRTLIRSGWTLILAAEGEGPARRLYSIATDAGIGSRIVQEIDPTQDPSVLDVVAAPRTKGFVAPDLKLAIISESDLSGRVGATTRDMRKMPSRRRKGVDPLSLHPGDYIVHDQHGIGRFIELVSRTVGRGDGQVTRDYLVLEYAPSKRGQPGDRLFIPTDSLDQISKYTGSDQPALTKMGGADWEKTKAKARKAVKEIAQELIRLYAVRQATKGHAFGPDTPWQRELEDSFPYVETPDQLVTIDEVKADMEKPMPMDRLLTGDVGYGKTEIAVRAAFKAIQDGKQVALLVPTTLLVQQHAETFAERYAGFPVTIGTLSRFSTPKEAEKVKEGLASGGVDLVIGTHSLLSGAIAFKDLGLVIIDEEQRFGVEHKETLKALRADVDVLSMSATPIPRTLEMAVSGIREMSILQTPPEERQPVLTFVGAHTDAQVSAAIRRELLRDGQVFYVHNRVDSISSVAAHIQELVPEARIRVAHGKLNEHQLESVIVDFWNHDFDVLVCTTIVETGLDISNANTLIVDRADTFGLSQLHQLRGRVGRGRERAYAYFFYPPDRPLSETAHERLQTIAQNADLGAGLAVAQRDLEIRGAGNLLGGAQSGHIEGVGFDLYVRMVADAVAAFKGQRKEEKKDLRLDVTVDAHIPESYISAERLRLEVYGKIAAVENSEQEKDLRDEITDRYGPIPPQVDLLFEIARLRALLRQIGIDEVATQGKYLRIHPIELKESQALRLKRLYPGCVVKAAV